MDRQDREEMEDFIQISEDGTEMRHAIGERLPTGLAETLDTRSDEALREAARIHGVPGHSKMSRQAMIGALVKTMPLPATMKRTLSAAEAREWGLFKTALATGAVAEEDFGYMLEMHLQRAGFLTFCRQDGGFYLVLPDELRAAYAGELGEEYTRAKNTSILVEEFACAAVNLYGIIEIDEFASVFNMYGDSQLGAKEIRASLKKCAKIDTAFFIDRDLIVHQAFANGGINIARELAGLTKSYPRYLPQDWEEFLRHSSYGYLEDTPEAGALGNFLGEITGDNALAEYLLVEFNNLGKVSAPPEAYFGMLLQAKPETMITEEISSRLVELVARMREKTRLWIHKGYRTCDMTDPNLLEQAALSNKSTKPVRSDNVGRNALCPCGSGKKFKMCCGR